MWFGECVEFNETQKLLYNFSFSGSAAFYI
jgi:hypothetical protein